MLPLFFPEAQPECDGMERLTALTIRRASAIQSGDDVKKGKHVESEKAVDDTL